MQKPAPGHKRSHFLITGDLILNHQIKGMTIEHTQDNRAFCSLDHYRSPCSSATLQRNMAEPEPIRIDPNTAGELCLELSHTGECVQTARLSRSEQIHRLRCLMIIKRCLTGDYYRSQQ